MIAAFPMMTSWLVMQPTPTVAGIPACIVGLCCAGHDGRDEWTAASAPVVPNVISVSVCVG